MRSMQQQLGVLGTISVFAYRHRDTKKKLCRGKKNLFKPRLLSLAQCADFIIVRYPHFVFSVRCTPLNSCQEHIDQNEVKLTNLMYLFVIAISYVDVGQGKLLICDVQGLPNRINRVGTLNIFVVSTYFIDFNVYSDKKISFPPLYH